MKLLRARFVNFIGLTKTSDDVEIDFTHNESTFIMFAAQNGYGKTTILSHLQPFAGGNDNRVNLIIEGREGLKEIDLLDDDGTTIRIKHIYTPSNRTIKTTHKIASYLSIQGDDDDEPEELNGNGGSKTFVKLIEEIFGIDTDFFRLVRMGDSVNGFVSMNSADRKRFLSNLVPEMDDFVEKEKIVKGKLAIIRNKIKALSAQVSGVDSESLEESMKLIEDQLTLENSELERLVGELAVINDDVAEIVEQGYANPRALNSSITAKSRELNELIESLSFLEENNDITTEVCKTEIAELTKEINDNTLRLDGVKEPQNQVRADRAKVTASLALLKKDFMSKDEMTAQLNKLEKDISDDDNDIITINRIIEGYKNDFEFLKEMNTADSREYIKKILADERNMVRSIELAFVDINRIDPSVMSVFREELTEPDSVAATIESLKSQIPTDIDELKRELIAKELKVAEANSFNELDAHCSADDCPYETLASSVDEFEERITELKGLIKDRMYEKTSIESQLKDLPELTGFADTFSATCDTIRDFIELSGRGDNTLSDLEFLDAFNKSGVASFTASLSVEDALNTYLNQLTALNTANSSVRERKAKLETIRGRIGSVDRNARDIQSKTDELTELSKRWKEYEAQSTSITKQISDAKTDLARMEDFLERLEAKDALLDNKNILEKEIVESNALLKEFRELIELKDTTDSMIRTVRTQINTTTNRKSKLALELSNYLRNKEELDKVERQLSEGTAIQDALSVTKGIPLLINEAFFAGIRSIGNTFLDISFDGKLRLSKFQITDTEFNIFTEDATGRSTLIETKSQGELALLKISISFAIYAYANIKANYNFPFLYLDELDATLSAQNKEHFINMLKRQVSLLDISNVFIISHNREFWSEEMGLILLKEHGIDLEDEEMMASKTIVFNHADLNAPPVKEVA